MAKVTFLRPRQKEQKKKSATEAKAKLELLNRRAFDTTDDIEDIMMVKQEGQKELVEMEAIDAPHERELFRRGMGFDTIASRGYSISDSNVRHYYRLKMKLRRLLEEDPFMQEDFTKRIHLFYVNAKNNLQQRTVRKEQTNVEVVDQEPVIKYIPVPQWGRVAETDMEKKDE